MVSKKEQIDSILEDIKSLQEFFDIYADGSGKGRLADHPLEYSSYCDIIQRTIEVCPDNKTFFETLKKYGTTYDLAQEILYKTRDILKRQKKYNQDVVERKLFLGSKEKLDQAGKSFENGDYTSSFNNLNTALELVLKDKLNIPLTLTKINTANIIDVLVKHGIGPVDYLKEIQKHVLIIDNKIKHQGYNPLKLDAINGIKAMEDLLSHIEKMPLVATEEIRNKIMNQL